jgi:aquaporin Z
VLLQIASGKTGFDLVGSGFAADGFGEHSPGGYSMLAALLCEVSMTFMFLFIILGSTDSRAPSGFAPIAIGLGLTLIHLISIPVTNTSVNPAHSTSQALFVGGWAIQQLWLFWIAPIVGAILAGSAYRAISVAPNQMSKNLLVINEGCRKETFSNVRVFSLTYLGSITL